MNRSLLTTLILSFFLILGYYIILESQFNKKLEYYNNEIKVVLEATKNDTIIIYTPIYIDTNKIKTPLYFNKDSLERAELIRDSIAFRKTVKVINGGYNGFNDRYEIWLRARKAFKKNGK